MAALLTLQTRIRDAELSVRTANLLCKTFGEDVTFAYFKEQDERLVAQIVKAVGRKGLKELREITGYAIENSCLSAVDRTRGTKTLRDEFAMAAITGLISHYGNDAGYDLQADAYGIADDMMEARAK